MESTTFAVGDLVTADPMSFPGLGGKVMRITKVPVGARGVNYVAVPVDGGRGARGPARCFHKHEGDETSAPAPVVVVEVPYIPMPDPGSVVLIAGRGWPEPADKLWVVTAESRKGGVKVSPLGGSTRYYPHVPLTAVTVVPLAALAERLVDAL